MRTQAACFKATYVRVLLSLRERLKGAIGSFNGACARCIHLARPFCVSLSLRPKRAIDSFNSACA